MPYTLVPSRVYTNICLSYRIHMQEPCTSPRTTRHAAGKHLDKAPRGGEDKENKARGHGDEEEHKGEHNEEPKSPSPCRPRPTPQPPPLSLSNTTRTSLSLSLQAWSNGSGQAASKQQPTSNNQTPNTNQPNTRTTRTKSKQTAQQPLTLPGPHKQAPTDWVGGGAGERERRLGVGPASTCACVNTCSSSIRCSCLASSGHVWRIMPPPP